MKLIIAILIILLGVLQYKLWFASGGLIDVHQLKQQLSEQEFQNVSEEEKNAQLRAEVDDLKEGQDAIEEHARKDLGMIKDNEVFYQLVEPAMP